jgi:hypothetical protein
MHIHDQEFDVLEQGPDACVPFLAVGLRTTQQLLSRVLLWSGRLRR